MNEQSSRLVLRPFTAEDAAAVDAWSAYPAEFAELDYALRQDGWLAEFRGRPAVHLLAATLAGELIAFALLAVDSANAAEFRIALHPARIAQGYGRLVAELSLRTGFGDFGLERIHLVVRQNNRRAIALYRSLGFSEGGECCLVVNGQPTAFFRMDLRRRDYCLTLPCQIAPT